MSASAEALPLIISEPSSARADAFRVLRVRLEQSLARAKLRSVLVTSPTGHEKRHEVGANLAGAFAECGVAAVLVDADLHQPSLHRHFGVDVTPGLLQTLTAGADWRQALRTTPLSGLSLLTAGGTDDVPARLLAAHAVSPLLAQMADDGMTLVVVAPPVLAAADANLLASQVDGVVLVTTALRTSRSSLKDAKQRLEGSGARIFGAVLDGSTSASY